MTVIIALNDANHSIRLELSELCFATSYIELISIMLYRKKVAVIIAHPDDETLWTGGTLLSHPEWEVFVLCLCRKDDPDRAPKFKKALDLLNLKGDMADLDDGPAQTPQNLTTLSNLLLKMLPSNAYDMIITHSPLGEYTRHLRHEEIGKVVINLWLQDQLICKELLMFAYEDGNRMYFPRAIRTADICDHIPAKIWQQKYDIITKTYGFDRDSWEAKTTPTQEAFWRFIEKENAIAWLKNNSIS